MATYVLGTDDVNASSSLCDYLSGRLTDADVVHAVNSLPGGDRTDSTDVRDGEDAVNVVRSRLGALTTVETHQFVRGNEPHEDLLAHAAAVDADELVVGVRKRSPAADVVFGSTTRAVLLHADRPVVVVPLDDDSRM
ncbi:MAG: universal stress protein [Haloplanus sp.]